MAEKRTYVYLTDEELCLLDGRVGAETQRHVDMAVAIVGSVSRYPHLSPGEAKLVGSVVAHARAAGSVRRWVERIHSCPVCGKNPGCVRFKSGPRRGKEDPSRRITFQGVEYSTARLSMQGRVNIGACLECVEKVEPTIVAALRGVEAEVPDVLRATGEPVRKCYSNRSCSACGWHGHEGEMRQLPAMLGGWHPGGCPECPAVNSAFGRTIIVPADGFTVAEVAA